MKDKKKSLKKRLVESGMSFECAEIIEKEFHMSKLYTNNSIREFDTDKNCSSVKSKLIKDMRKSKFGQLTLAVLLLIDVSDKLFQYGFHFLK